MNRNIDEDLELSIDIRSLEGYQLAEHIVLEHSDMKIRNSAGVELVAPKNVDRSRMDGGKVTSLIKKTTWNVIRLKK